MTQSELLQLVEMDLFFLSEILSITYESKAFAEYGNGIYNINSHTQHLVVSDYIGVNPNDAKVSFIKSTLLPSVFMSSYKVLDMIVEFIIRKGNMSKYVSTPLIPYKQKIDDLSHMVNALGLSQNIFICILPLYREFSTYRHMWIHGKDKDTGNYIKKLPDKIAKCDSLGNILSEITNIDILNFANFTLNLLYIVIGMSIDFNIYELEVISSLGDLTVIHQQAITLPPKKYLFRFCYTLNDEEESTLVVNGNNIFPAIENYIENYKKLSASSDFVYIIEFKGTTSVHYQHLSSDTITNSKDKVIIKAI
ncbi:MAG: hypothetical protein LBN00_11535 [Oscillospiraceae bacterium]|nr:hypothetical protein [Oscillospiraceae bacterium]